MKKLLKVLKAIGIGLLAILIILVGVGFFMSEDLPEGKQGPEADEFARKIMQELNYEAFQDTRLIKWNFAGVHSYEWYKNDHYVIITSEDYEVKLDLKDYSKSEVINSNTSDHESLIQTCIKNFNNDSYWLIAPYKIMDKNVERKIVNEDGEKALLVTFTEGGTTPGDSYLWKVDEEYRPVSFDMWVSVIPVGGLEAKWKDWVETQSGMIVSTTKTFYGIPIEITNLETRR